MSQTLEEFKEYLKEMEKYKTVTRLIQWDISNGAPKNGIPALIDAMEYFSTKQFELQTSEKYGELLEKLSVPEEFDTLDDAMKLTVKRYGREYKKDKRIPQEFYTEYIRANAYSQQAWKEAKQKSDYSIFCPHLQKMIDMKKEMTGYTNPGENVYEVLLDTFEEGMDSQTIDRLFDEIKKELVPFVREIAGKPQPDAKLFRGTFSIDAQKHLQDFLLEYMGFSRESGTTGESEHPFTETISRGDVRVTNHYKEDEAINAMFSAIHEGGHAIFDQSIDKALDGTAAAEVEMMGLHESQSRFYENILGRNINFWKPVYEKVGEFLPLFKERTLEQFEREINRVQCSYIRTEADEVTYAFHIILRYELEKAIFNDGATAEELPKLWNEKMEELLGLTPENDAQGILQDMHWSDASFGYFPSYLLGTIYDGMFLEALERDLGDVDAILAEGRIKEITGWLNEKIHRFGSLYPSKEVIRRVCGQEISAQPIIRHFKKKYTKLYEL